jgi:hypothetical protein
VIYGNHIASIYNTQLPLDRQASWKYRQTQIKCLNTNLNKMKKISPKSSVTEIISQPYPVLQTSLIMLTESAVTTKASAQARWPMCGFGSGDNNISSVHNKKNLHSFHK